MNTPIHELPNKWREEQTFALAKAVAELFAAELEAALADQWQPIESCPKQEEVYLLGNHPKFPEWGIGYLNEHGRFVCDVGGQITHWMPLPPAPTPKSHE